MVYLYWAGALIVIGPVIVGLPLLSRSRVYRAAALFAGINAGIVTLSYFINLLRWGVGPAHAERFHVYFTHSLPSYYIASLIIGATIVSRYYLNTSTRIGAWLATLSTLVGIYVLSAVMVRALEILFITVEEGVPSYDLLSDIAHHLFFLLMHPSFSFLMLITISTLIALNGTAAAMRLSDEEDTFKDEDAEQH